MKLANQPLMRLLSRIARPVTRQRRQWMAVTLRWRSARRRQPVAVMRPQVPMTSYHWATQFSLHFGGAHPTVDHRRPMPLAPSHMTRLLWRRTIGRTSEKIATIRVFADREIRHFTRITEKNVVPRLGTIREKKVATTLPPVGVTMPRSRQPGTPGAGLSRAPIEVARNWRRDRLIEAGAVSTARHATGRVAAAPAQVHWAGEARRDTIKAKPARETPRQAPAPRGAHLVWRIQQRERTAEPDVPVPAHAATQASVQTTSPIMSAASPAQAGALLRQQALDPAMVERLADDVINRVERRLRIERERRGL